MQTGENLFDSLFMSKIKNATTIPLKGTSPKKEKAALSKIHAAFLRNLLLVVLFVKIKPSDASILRRPTVVTWVNGVGFSVEHMVDATPIISKLFGGEEVEFCHNPTAMTSDDDYMGYIGDMTQAGTQKLGRITGEVDALVSHLRDALKKVGSYGRVVHIAHSQGALITYLAAKRLSPSELSRIEVVSFGGAAALCRSERNFARCVNYYSINDPLLFVVPSAVKALRSGFLTPGGYSGKLVNSSSGSSAMGARLTEEIDMEPEFVFLSPRAGDPAIDHSLLGPTYGEALAWEGRRYQSKYQPVLYRVGKQALVEMVATWHSLLIRIHNVMMTVLRKMLLPFISFVMETNAKIKHTVVILASPIFRRIILPFISFVMETNAKIKNMAVLVASPIFRQIILPFISFVMRTNEGIKNMLILLVRTIFKRVIVPIVFMSAVIWDMIMNPFRSKSEKKTDESLLEGETEESLSEEETEEYLLEDGIEELLSEENIEEYLELSED
mmetsp:Transcript_28240/g.37654  ORF Transcript_28240/g.37654 Transcript_28240/m.37654 type:complete len:499 (+) Transcript_28240:125-1621(+)